MKITDAIAALRQASKLGKYVFNGADFQMLMPEDTQRSVIATVSRLADSGILTRACQGVYVYEDGRPHQSDVLYEVAGMIRRGSLSYVSLEQSLSAYGVISQIPMRMTLMTTGRKGEFHTPWGTIEFTHTERKPLEILERCVVQPNLPLRLALPDMALEDLKHVRRNLHLVNMEDYEEAMENVRKI